MNEKNGFTLIELLIVLAIISIIALFIVPSLHKTVLRQEQKHFFKIFASDIFYIQNQKLFKDFGAEISALPTNYVIIDRGEKRKRNFPDGLTLLYFPEPLSFSRNGTLKNPSTYWFYHDEGRYRYTFPFGKGRGYLEEM